MTIGVVSQQHMARTLDAILAELNQRTDPQRSTILNQIAELPKQQQDQEAGLRAQLDAANNNILAGARRRGLGFSGIPLQEQAQYAATEFAPALARNAAQYSQQKYTLESALNDLGSRNYQSAYDIYNTEVGRDFEAQKFAEQQRQFNEQMALERQKAAAEQAQSDWLRKAYGSNGSAATATQGAQADIPVTPQTQQQYNSLRFLQQSDENAFNQTAVQAINELRSGVMSPEARASRINMLRMWYGLKNAPIPDFAKRLGV